MVAAVVAAVVDADMWPALVVAPAAPSLLPGPCPAPLLPPARSQLPPESFITRPPALMAPPAARCATAEAVPYVTATCAAATLAWCSEVAQSSSFRTLLAALTSYSRTFTAAGLPARVAAGRGANTRMLTAW